eukprot:CAMPEP_0113665142 /NCGR_PEP_ID=MMETSP0038_2-20120614/2136_1 /TAXON_ID=2898 /ORGANISM="Cryptomonas paramecium" /LENGTH=34 /DNA_ID=CAMNT_0000580453 /DNA_START=478 /DNA_END=582 /DNA_ORIENTATION=- /assembly_acc=CAM_ASM_000170
MSMSSSGICSTSKQPASWTLTKNMKEKGRSQKIE